MDCRLSKEGFEHGSCQVFSDGSYRTACEVTLKWEKDTPHRLIHSYAHKAPEQYLSIYQSGCNWSCKKCHSWRFSKHASGFWMSPEDIAKASNEYAQKNRTNMYEEPKDHATSWHAHELCRNCGSCILTGERSDYCPGRLREEQITLLDDLMWGPARNIISFTGGDLACQPEFYVKATKLIKDLEKNLWVLFETNGHGMTPRNLDLFREAGVDSFWLDIKAYDDGVHHRLTGSLNERILGLPLEIVERGFTLEVSTVHIPGWVEVDQIRAIAVTLAQVDPDIPYGIIAFFPEHKLINIPSPNYNQMVKAFEASVDAGLKNVRLGNLGRFVKTNEEYKTLFKMGAI